MRKYYKSTRNEGDESLSLKYLNNSGVVRETQWNGFTVGEDNVLEILAFAQRELKQPFDEKVIHKFDVEPATIKSEDIDALKQDDYSPDDAKGYAETVEDFTRNPIWDGVDSDNKAKLAQIFKTAKSNFAEAIKMCAAHGDFETILDITFGSDASYDESLDDKVVGFVKHFKENNDHPVFAKQAIEFAALAHFGLNYILNNAISYQGENRTGDVPFRAYASTLSKTIELRDQKKDQTRHTRMVNQMNTLAKVYKKNPDSIDNINESDFTELFDNIDQAVADYA